MYTGSILMSRSTFLAVYKVYRVYRGSIRYTIVYRASRSENLGYSSIWRQIVVIYRVYLVYEVYGRRIWYTIVYKTFLRNKHISLARIRV